MVRSHYYDRVVGNVAHFERMQDFTDPFVEILDSGLKRGQISPDLLGVLQPWWNEHSLGCVGALLENTMHFGEADFCEERAFHVVCLQNQVLGCLYRLGSLSFC